MSIVQAMNTLLSAILVVVPQAILEQKATKEIKTV